MKKKPDAIRFLREFDQSQGKRRVNARKNVSLPVGLVLDASLPLSAGRVYGALKFLQIGDDPVRVSHRHLMELTGLSRNTVRVTITRMKKAGWLKVERYLGGLNTYDFSTPGAAPEENN
ncbi:MAG TPA: hypothetical protein VK308_15570 [Pyrinomonadaceae bacterium]|nr:hypothetical protein [Pyrinomonadaceae bacterium]